MKDWKRTPVPKTVEALNDKIDRLVDSLPDFEFMDGVQLLGTAGGEEIAHPRPGRVPRRVFVELDNADSGADVEVSNKGLRTVRLHAFDARTLSLLFVY